MELREYNEWVVVYGEGKNDYYQLHSGDVNWIEEMKNMFDDMEGRIKADPEVEFDVVEHQKLTGVAKYAKLRK